MIRIEPVDPLHGDALALLCEATVEARALYADRIGSDAPWPTNPPAAPRTAYLLARIKGRAVACGALRPLDDQCAEMRRIFVTQDARCSGVARTVIEALEQQARALGFGMMRLETGDRQQAAQALYAGCGYRPIASFGSYAKDASSRCFEKVLGP